MTQQALDNVDRHAEASRVVIQLTASRRRGSPGTRLIVRDDGHGFDVAAVDARPDGGIGLLNMRERIEALGGRLSIRSGPKGTEVEAFLPHKATKEDHHDARDDKF
jgi:two-component system NarL family sensor kinase